MGKESLAAADAVNDSENAKAIDDAMSSQIQIAGIILASFYRVPFAVAEATRKAAP
jgi:hypothetical protein